ncbi:ABC transporter ATP-binding protein [Humibacter ginsenosidimutans]|uniref:ABC transporter ATP-binding protein n=1 Tax=Humibacter ginsenosidimutans TaxID=2599293 RepID=A0A5B8M564_9MICO|nr:ABC transporter ATP-binding protein [Humibacter ginsenosidimutans]QDZ14985.1 ABC transporter ATP-binding protein [Humibacter ginsenosidimutans]
MATENADSRSVHGMKVLLQLARVHPARWVVTTAVLSLLLALLDMIGVAAMVPLMQLFSTTESQSSVVKVVVDILGTNDPAVLIPAFALCVALLFIVSSALMILFRWWLLGRTTRIGADAATELLRRYALAPYADHRSRNLPDVYRNINDMTTIASNTLLNAVTVVSDAMTLVGICVVLMIASPLVTLFAIALFAGAMVAFQRSLRRRQLRVGEELAAASLDAWAHIMPVLDGFREARLSSSAERFVRGFGEARIRTARANQAYSLLSELPKYLLQIIFILAVAGMAAILFVTGSASDALTVLAIFAAAALRGLPTMTRVSANIGSVRSGTVSLGLLTEAADTLNRSVAHCEAPRSAEPYRGDIVLRSVGFHYPDDPAPVLRDLDMKISEHTTTAIVGASGAGKSTVIDLILGLQQPTSGEITCGGVSINDDVARWYEGLGVVPQDVFLLNDTLEANITYGRPLDDADRALLHEVVRMAQLDSYVRSLANGLKTIVGERGTRLSGGQRQRVGLARALFRRPRVLVLDEATSALDNETEHQITQTLRALHGQITVIIVAHRLSTVRDADKLVFLSDGTVEGEGSFTEVRASTPSFARLVELGELA